MRETLLCAADHTEFEMMKAVCIKIIRNHHTFILEFPLLSISFTDI